MPLTADEVIIQQTNTYPRDKDRRHYAYQSSFGNHPPIFKIFGRFPWFIGQSSDIYWSKHRRENRDYLYPNYFGSEAWFYNLKNLPWFIGQSNDIYWSKHRRKNKDYLYPDYFGSEAWFKNLKNVPWCISWFSNRTEYWLKHRRVNRDYIYPSFFMCIKAIPSEVTTWVTEPAITDTWVKEPEIP